MSVSRRVSNLIESGLVGTYNDTFRQIKAFFVVIFKLCTNFFAQTLACGCVADKKTWLVKLLIKLIKGGQLVMNL